MARRLKMIENFKNRLTWHLDEEDAFFNWRDDIKLLIFIGELNVIAERRFRQPDRLHIGQRAMADLRRPLLCAILASHLAEGLKDLA